MTNQEIRSNLCKALAAIAPEADPSALGDDADVREELDIDSMDFLRYVTKLHDLFGVPIEEPDYPKLFTLGGAERYFASALSR